MPTLSADSIIPANTAVPVDMANFNELTGGDSQFARDLAATFVDSGHQQLTDIEKALTGMDRVALARAAHKLKGACANIYAQPLCDLATRLEHGAPTEELVTLRHVSEALSREFTRTNEFLADNLPGTASDARLPARPASLQRRS